jgi:hypothetical protein
MEMGFFPSYASGRTETLEGSSAKLTARDSKEAMPGAPGRATDRLATRSEAIPFLLRDRLGFVVSSIRDAPAALRRPADPAESLTSRTARIAIAAGGREGNFQYNKR